MLYLEQEPKVKNQNGGNISVVTSAVYVSLDENFRNYIDNGGNNLVSEKLKLSNVKYSSQRLCPIDINNRLVYLDSEVYPDSSAFENAVN